MESEGDRKAVNTYTLTTPSSRQETLQSLQRLDEHDIQFYSYQEPYLPTLNTHTRELIISVLSWVAQMESERRSERVKAGTERARPRANRSADLQQLRMTNVTGFGKCMTKMI